MRVLSVFLLIALGVVCAQAQFTGLAWLQPPPDVWNPIQHGSGVALSPHGEIAAVQGFDLYSGAAYLAFYTWDSEAGNYTHFQTFVGDIVPDLADVANPQFGPISIKFAWLEHCNTRLVIWSWGSYSTQAYGKAYVLGRGVHDFDKTERFKLIQTLSDPAPNSPADRIYGQWVEASHDGLKIAVSAPTIGTHNPSIVYLYQLNLYTNKYTLVDTIQHAFCLTGCSAFYGDLWGFGLAGNRDLSRLAVSAWYGPSSPAYTRDGFVEIYSLETSPPTLLNTLSDGAFVGNRSRFGYSLAMDHSGDKIVIGAFEAFTQNFYGVALEYDLRHNGSAYTRNVLDYGNTTVTGATPGQGASVCINHDGSLISVGAPYDAGTPGAMYNWARTPSDTYTLSQRLTPFDGSIPSGVVKNEGWATCAFSEDSRYLISGAPSDVVGTVSPPLYGGTGWAYVRYDPYRFPAKHH